MCRFFVFVLLFLFRLSIENGEALQRAVILSKGPCFIGQECPLVVNLPTIDPDLELTVDFGDGSDPVRMGNLSFILNTFQSTTGYSCILRHGIDTGGEYLVKATANTELKPGVRYVAAFSTTIRIKCSVPGLKVTRLSPEKLEQIARNETLVFHVKLIQNCTTRPVAIEWSLFVGPLDKNESVCLKDQKQAAEAEIKILPYSLLPGLYHLKVTGKVPYHNPQKYIQVVSLVSFEIVSLMLQTVLIGPVVADFEETVKFDASKSFDPNVDPSSGSSPLNFTWHCLPGRWERSRFAEMASISFNGLKDCLYEECACVNGTDVDRSSSVITWPSDKLYRQPSPVSYTVAVSIQSGIGMSFELHSLRFGADSQDHAVLDTTHHWDHGHVTGPGLHIEDLPDIEVICLTNCMEYVEHTRALVLCVHCHNCLPQEDVAYAWEFWPANINCTLQTIDWEADVLGGNRKSRLVIPKRTFENITGDEGYQFIATVTRPGGKQSKAGYSCYFARYSGFIIPRAVEETSACKQYNNQLLLLVSALFCLFLNLIE